MEAIHEIESILESCNDDVFLGHCIQWMQLCCKNDSISDKNSKNARLDLFVKLIKLSASFPELVRPISNTVVPRFTDFLFKKMSKSRKGWEALEVVMSIYSGSLIHCKETLEILMASSVESSYCPPSQARCWALLPSIGGGGIKGVVFATSWTTQFNRLLDSSHYLLNEIFRDIAEFQAYTCSGDNVIKVNGSHDYSCNDLANFMSNTCTTMQCMLLGYYPVAKNVPVGKIMELVNRIMSVASVNMGNRQTGRIISLQDALPAVVKAALKVITATIVSVGRALLPIATTMSSTLQQAAQVTAEWPQLRLPMYSALSNWIVVSRGACCLQAWPKQLIFALLNDFEPAQTMIKLKNKTNNAKGTKTRLQSGTRDTQELIRCASVETFSLLVNAVGPKLSPLIHKTIQLNVVRQLGQRSAGEQDTRASARCRVSLYSLLEQLCLEPSPCWPPPTQFAMELLRIGVRDPSPIVSTACSASISVLERIIHPEFTVASFPVDHAKVVHDMQKEILVSFPGVSDMDNFRNGVEERKLKTITKASSPWQAGTSKSQDIKNLNEENEGSEMVEISSSPPSTTNDECQVQAECPEKQETFLPALKRRKLQENNQKQIYGYELETTSIDALGVDTDAEVVEILSDNEVNIISQTRGAAVPVDVNSGVSEWLETEEGGIQVLSTKKEGRRGRVRECIMEGIDVDLPMSLRSGTLVSSPSSDSRQRQRLRNGDHSSVVDSSRSTPSIPSTPSAQSSPSSAAADPDTIIDLFDETLNPHLQ